MMKVNAVKKFQVSLCGMDIAISARYRSGGNDLVLFVHGLGCSKESFDDAFTYPGFADFRLLAIDLPGFGDSSKLQEFSYTMEDQARVLMMVLERIGFSRLHIIAHSMGSAVALLAAEKISANLATFVNVEGNLIAEDCGLLSRRTIQIPFADFQEKAFDRFRSKGPRPWREQSSKADPLAFYKSCQSLVSWSDSGKLLERFTNLRASTLYVYGDQNSDMAILTKLRGIRKVEIPDSGHFVMNDNPEEFYRQAFKVIVRQRPS